ncbi:hypothetical protein ACF3MZ_03890 [Paenibacillaceae bacterium WGS1546]
MEQGGAVGDGARRGSGRWSKAGQWAMEQGGPNEEEGLRQAEST